MFPNRVLNGVFLTAGAVFLAVLFGMTTIARQRKTYGGFRQWTLASLSVAVGMVLIGFRNRIPAFLSVILANLAVMTSLMLIHDGLMTFMGRKLKRLFYLIPFAALVLPYLYLTYLHPALRVRIVLSSVLYVACCAVILRFYLRVVLPAYPRNWLVPAGFMVLVFLFAGDVAYAVFRLPRGSKDFMAAGVGEVVIIIAAFSAVILIIMGLIVLNAQRTEEELKKAMAEVKTLRGIVPICASCKRIRDDEGYWNAVESYVQDHTEAQFSHGLCPDCARRLYPGIS